MSEVGRYYDQQISSEIGKTGAGLIWILGRDHLSPSYINDDQYALNASNWREGASRRVLDLISRQRISQGDRVLDIGTGIGGPGRDVVQATGASVYGVNISLNQLKTLRELSAVAKSTDGIHYQDVINGDTQYLPIIDSAFDHVFSINMFYHIPNVDLAISDISRVLRAGGTFGLDDWFLTENTTDDTAKRLRHEWSTPTSGFHKIQIIRDLMRSHNLEIFKEVDFTREAGEFLTEERFGKTFDTQVRPQIIESFPKLYQYDGYVPEHAEMAATQLRDAIMLMGQYYRDGQAVYKQIIARKS